MGFRFVLPIDQFVYFWIFQHIRLNMLDKLLLDFFSYLQIQLQINRCGLNIFMSQFISDIRYRVAVSEHFIRTGTVEPVTAFITLPFAFVGPSFWEISWMSNPLVVWLVRRLRRAEMK
jgi:hypothetical protein